MEEVQADEKEKSLDKMTVKDLRVIAKSIPGVTGTTAMKKDDLLAIIKEFREIKEEAPAAKKKKKKKKPGKAMLSIKEVKKEVVHLREKKKAAQQAKDKKQIDILRRRINRLKKRTRRVVQG
ncbi:MAG: Rho termination factor N-terminal domain-containing protein [Deltaproteobacteria bacterium]|nr:Rho termination factor N-terminal domain-containing protein [Deltaproteobacteria bacterium]